MAQQNQELKGRVALVTGGARNIGKAISRELAQAGAGVVINTRSSRSEADNLAAEINAAGGKAMVCVADVTDRAAVKRMVDEAVAKLGGLDILVNNAVAHGVTSFDELSFETWARTISVTLDGAFHCTQACLPHLDRGGQGTIVNIGGMFGHKPNNGRSATAAAKAGLAGLTRALAQELAPRRITVNYLSPGPVNTVRDTPLKIDVTTIPLQRLAEPGEVSAVVRMLCGPGGRYITGQSIHVNGGLFMNS